MSSDSPVVSTPDGAEKAGGEPLQEAGTMAALRKRMLVLAAIMVPAVVLTVWLVVTQSRAVRTADLAEKVIPAMLMGSGRTWTSSSVTFSEEELDILETRDYVCRTYSDGKGTPVDLCVIFSEDNRKGTHPPDICLEGSGLRIVSRYERTGVYDGTPVPMRELITTSASGQYTYFVYFYKCGDTFTPSFYRQQAQIIWNGLTRQNASGALVRYSTAMSGPADLDRARTRTDELIALTFPPIRDGLSAH